MVLLVRNSGVIRNPVSVVGCTTLAPSQKKADVKIKERMS